MSNPKLEITEAGPLKIASVPCLSDNFGYLVLDQASGAVGSVDAPEAGPLKAALSSLGWTLSHLILTHHHADHIDGVEALRGAGKVTVVGSSVDAARLPALDLPVEPGDSWHFGGQEVQTIDTPGHTVGHIVHYLPDAGVLFSGDTMFAMGCGRLFEGTAAQMWGSLARLAQLPDETLVFFGHEYTMANGKFALSVDEDNADLKDRMDSLAQTIEAGGRSTPTSIGLEKRTNPFLRSVAADLAEAVGLPGADPAIVFAELRRRKDAS